MGCFQSRDYYIDKAENNSTSEFLTEYYKQNISDESDNYDEISINTNYSSSTEYSDNLTYE